MALVTTAAIAGAALGSGGLIGGAIAGGAAYGLGAAMGYDPISAYESAFDMLQGPEIPDAPQPEPEVKAGDEGIRRGESKRQSMRKKAMGEAFLTRGQERGIGANLGGMAKTLG